MLNLMNFNFSARTAKQISISTAVADTSRVSFNDNQENENSSLLTGGKTRTSLLTTWPAGWNIWQVTLAQIFELIDARIFSGIPLTF